VRSISQCFDLATAGKCFLDKKNNARLLVSTRRLQTSHSEKTSRLCTPFDDFIKPRSNQLNDGIADTFVSVVEVLSVDRCGPDLNPIC